MSLPGHKDELGNHPGNQPRWTWESSKVSLGVARSAIGTLAQIDTQVKDAQALILAPVRELAKQTYHGPCHSPSQPGNSLWIRIPERFREPSESKWEVRGTTFAAGYPITSPTCGSTAAWEDPMCERTSADLYGISLLPGFPKTMSM